jgi:hypothetical protein
MDKPGERKPVGRALVLLGGGCGCTFELRQSQHLRWNRVPAAVNLDLAKYLGEGTSRKEAEEESSAFLFLPGSEFSP